MELTEIDTLTVIESIVALAEAEGATPLRRSEDAWVTRVDDHWHVAVNPHTRVIRIALPDAMTVDLAPFHAAVWFNGWSVGIVNPASGWFWDGQEINAQMFIAAVERRIAQEKQI